VVRSTHGVNCSGSCSWRIHVKDGLVTWETQQTDYPSNGPETPDYEPRGCPRGASFSWYVYSPLRPKHPYVRGVLLEIFREARERLGDPVEAWAAIVEDPEKARAYKSQRGKGGFLRADWDEVTELIAAAHVHTIRRHGPDRIAIIFAAVIAVYAVPRRLRGALRAASDEADPLDQGRGRGRGGRPHQTDRGNVKRAEALQPLSRDHLKALLAAKALREAADADAARAAFLEFWRDHGAHHFRVEEEVLLPQWALYAEVDRPAVERMLEEHLRIRRAALRLEGGGRSLEELRALGDLLHDHVRFEERTLFPVIEDSLSAEQLARLLPAVLAAEAH
jgi:hemerythrin superfamily protein